jgi:hypothetical protein
MVSAVEFLSTPSVRTAPAAKKAAFLLSKGLTMDQVRLAFSLTGSGDPFSQPQPQPQPQPHLHPSAPQQQQQQQAVMAYAPPASSSSSLMPWAVAIGGISALSAGAYYLYSSIQGLRRRVVEAEEKAKEREAQSSLLLRELVEISREAVRDRATRETRETEHFASLRAELLAIRGSLAQMGGKEKEKEKEKDRERDPSQPPPSIPLWQQEDSSTTGVSDPSPSKPASTPAPISLPPPKPWQIPK